MYSWERLRPNAEISIDAIEWCNTIVKCFCQSIYFDRFEFIACDVFDSGVTNAIPPILERLPVCRIYIPRFGYAGKAKIVLKTWETPFRITLFGSLLRWRWFY